MLLLWAGILTAAADPGWVIEPLAPAAGIRLAPQGQVQFDVLLQPRFRRQTSRFEANGTDESVDTTELNLGGEIAGTLRLGLRPTRGRPTLSLGGSAGLRRIILSSASDLVAAPDPYTTFDARAWVGAGAIHPITKRWSVGFDIELAGLEWRSSNQLRSSSALTVISNPSRTIDLNLLSGAHLFLSVQP
ncbi:MAG: hypothetical protein AAGA48_04660 [Myxococcota bacterium]